MVVHGPNLNLLGIREPETYGATTLEKINQNLQQESQRLQVSLSCLQSNHEGDLVDAIQRARGKHQGIVINAGAYTHTSIGIADAIKAISVPVVEVHISNTFGREEFRHKSYISPNAKGVILGFGMQSYALAVQSFIANA